MNTKAKMLLVISVVMNLHNKRTYPNEGKGDRYKGEKRWLILAIFIPQCQVSLVCLHTKDTVIRSLLTTLGPISVINDLVSTSPFWAQSYQVSNTTLCWNSGMHSPYNAEHTFIIIINFTIDSPLWLSYKVWKERIWQTQQNIETSPYHTQHTRY